MSSQTCAEPAPSARRPSAQATIALIGNPNTGKTTLFNRLCRARAKTANFPGTTSTLRASRADLGSGRRVEIVDLPGTYSVHAPDDEGRMVRDILQGTSGRERPDVLVVMLDATNLARTLVLAGELIARGETVVAALNMMDAAKRRGVAVDAPALARSLGVAVVPMSAAKGRGIAELRQALAAALGAGPRPDAAPRARGPRPSIEAMSGWAEEVARAVTAGDPLRAHRLDLRTDRVDRVLTHPIGGALVFGAVMAALFWAIFALARVPMGLIELLFGQAGTLVGRLLPPGLVRDLAVNGLLGGVAGTAVFLPQICLLFLLISLLEDTGYLARAAFVTDRFFRRFGLPGQAFVPLLTAHACAIPAVLGARLIADRRDRLTTILVAPFMSCSARLPVYVLLASLLFADRPALAAAMFTACYLIGAVAAFASALLFSRTVLKGRARPLILELPRYRVPSIMNALVAAKDQGLAFLKTVGTVIVAISVVMWWVSAFPRAGAQPAAEALRADAHRTGISAEASDELTRRAAAIDANAQQAGSIVGRLGRGVAPVFQPLGYDWQLTVGVLTSFIAREAFVSTMSVLAGPGGGDGVVDRIRVMTRADGSPLFTRATAASVLIFFVLAMQCLPTLAMTRRETGGLKYAAFQLGYMFGCAYAAAFVVFHALRMIGVA